MILPILVVNCTESYLNLIASPSLDIIKQSPTLLNIRNFEASINNIIFIFTETMEINIIDSETISIRDTCTLNYNGIDWFYSCRIGWCTDWVVRWSYRLYQCSIPIDLTSTTIEFSILSACPIVWNCKICHGFWVMLGNHFKGMCWILSIKFEDCELWMISPFNCHGEVFLLEISLI